MTEKMDEMRKMYHKDLNNMDNIEFIQKKKLETKLSRNDGNLNAMASDLIESFEDNNTHFFEATENLPKDLKDLLQATILKQKVAF